MATIEKRTKDDGSTTYRVKVRLRGYPTESATFVRITDAKNWAQRTEAAMREGRHFKTVEAKRHTLGELIDRYTRDVLPRKSKSSQFGNNQTSQLNWWKDELGAYLLCDVSAAKIAEKRDELESSTLPSGKDRSPSTVNRYLAALSHAFTIAVREWGWLEDNPMRKVSRLKEPRGRVRFLSDKEREALLSACLNSASPHLYLVVVLALSTGARYSEIMKLRWDDVDMKRGLMILHETKNGERRTLPLTGHAMKLMKEHAKVRRIDTELVFPNKLGDAPQGIRRAFEQALKDAKIKDFRFHDLRHSAASYLAMNGASLAEIAEVLGHKTLQMVKRYAHLSEAHTSKVVAAMNERIFG